MRSSLSLLALVPLAAPASAQLPLVPSGLWGASSAAGPTGAVCRIEGAGPPTTFPWTPTVTPLTGPVTGDLITPPCVAKHMAGVVLVADAGRFDAFATAGPAFGVPLTTSFGSPGAFEVYAPLGLLAVKPDGNVWVTTSTYPPFLTEVSVTGAVVQPVPLPGGLTSLPGPTGPILVAEFVPERLVADGLGVCWVGSDADLVRVAPDGTTTVLLDAPGGELSGLDVDPLARPWILADGGTPQATLHRLLPDAASDLAVPVPGASAFDLDACGRPHVLVGASLQVRDGATGALVEVRSLAGAPTLAFPLPGQPPRLTVDPDGGAWVRSVGLIDRFDADGTLVFSTSDCQPGVAQSARLDAGDATGLHLAAVLDRDGDADQDGVPNGRELELGTDPFDAADRPARLQVTTPPTVGGTLTLAASLPGEAGRPYLVAAARGTAGIPLGPASCRVVPLALDGLFQVWLQQVATGAAVGAFGLLDPAGAATVSVALPPTALGGLEAYFALVTLEGGRVREISDATRVVLP